MIRDNVPNSGYSFCQFSGEQRNWKRPVLNGQNDSNEGTGVRFIA